MSVRVDGVGVWRLCEFHRLRLIAEAESLIAQAGLPDPPYNVTAYVDPRLAPESRYQIRYDRDDESLVASGATPAHALAALRNELSGACRAARVAAATP